MADRDSRNAKVKNRAPAEIQITAEQLLREAQERQEVNKLAPRQRIEDFEELQEYRSRKRQEFEEIIRRTRSNIRAWIKYANWEASQNEFERARSVFERALDVDTQDVKLWLAYTETELKARNVNHARNLFDRAVTLLPRLDQIWYKYVYLEELLGNIPGARQVFERWMAWKPDEKAWSAYIKFEVRYKEFDLASELYKRLVDCHPEPKQFIKWSKYEEERGHIDQARLVYQTALQYFGEEEEQLAKAQSVYSGFAKMEIRQKEYERARVIYKYALDRLPRSKSSQLYASYTNFEKQHGDQRGLESTIIGKRRMQYQEEIAHSPHNYDTWFDYIRLEEDALRNLRAAEDPDEEQIKLVRDVYEKAIAQVPPSDQKRHWRRYIFLWLNYALFEEIDCNDTDRARSVYKAAMQLVPHKTFTFAKLWLQYAYFEIRNEELTSARKILGTSIGLCPKQRLFKGYIELELQLKEFDRCRQLYQKNLEFDPSNASSWIKFAELEQLLEDFSRARAIFELGVEEPSLEMSEILWKAYIDFEFEMEEWDRTRALYERLLNKEGHVKVWASFASFEINVGKTRAADLTGDDDGEEENDEPQERDLPEEVKEQIREIHKDALSRAREIFQKGYKSMKSRGLKDERVVLLEAWESMEKEFGDQEGLDNVQNMKPKTVQKMRILEDGTEDKVRVDLCYSFTCERWLIPIFSLEPFKYIQYYEFIFRDDEAEKGSSSFHLLEMAHAWKKKKEMASNQNQPQQES